MSIDHGKLLARLREIANGLADQQAMPDDTWERQWDEALATALSAHGQPPPRVTQEMANSLHETAQLLDEVDRRSEARREKYGLHGQPVVDEDALLAVAVKAWDEHQMNCRITTVSGSLRQVVKAIRAALEGAAP